MSAQETVYRLLSLPMKQLSRSVLFVDTNPKSERIAVLKYNASLSQPEDNDTNVFQKSLIDRYQHRPQALSSMCLAEFAATYVVNYERNECDALPAPESDVTNWFRAKLMLYYPWFDELEDLLGGMSNTIAMSKPLYTQMRPNTQKQK